MVQASLKTTLAEGDAKDDDDTSQDSSTNDNSSEHEQEVSCPYQLSVWRITSPSGGRTGETELVTSDHFLLWGAKLIFFHYLIISLLAWVVLSWYFAPFVHGSNCKAFVKFNSNITVFRLIDFFFNDLWLKVLYYHFEWPDCFLLRFTSRLS